MIAETIKKLIGMGYEINILPLNSPSGNFIIRIQYKEFKSEYVRSLGEIEYVRWNFDEYIGDCIERMVKEIEIQERR